MSTRIELIVNLQDSAKIPNKRERGKVIAAAGGLVHLRTDYQKTARTLSALPWVESVYATFIAEHHAGIWRNGRKT